MKDRHRFILAHIRALRNLPLFQNSAVYICPENNYGTTAAEIYQNITDSMVPNTFVVREQRDATKPGVCTTNENKQAAAETVNRLLRERRILMLENYVSGNPFVINNSESVAISRQTLYRQLLGLRKIITYSTARSDRPTVQITGKRDSNNRINGDQDDVAISALLGVYWYNQWLEYRIPPNNVIIKTGTPVSGRDSDMQQQQRRYLLKRKLDQR